MYKYFFYLLLGTSVRNMTQGFWKFFSQSLRVHSLYHTHSLAKFNGKCSSWLKNVYSARVHLEKLSRGDKSWVEGVGGITSLVSTLHIVFDNSKGGKYPLCPPLPELKPLQGQRFQCYKGVQPVLTFYNQPRQPLCAQYPVPTPAHLPYPTFFACAKPVFMLQLITCSPSRMTSTLIISGCVQQSIPHTYHQHWMSHCIWVTFLQVNKVYCMESAQNCL